MILIGYCIRCRRIRPVRFIGMLRGALAFGVCRGCEAGR